MSVLILTEKELRDIVKIDKASIDAVANAFLWLSKGLVTMPPIMHIEIPEHKGDVEEWNLGLKCISMPILNNPFPSYARDGKQVYTPF